MSSCRAPITVMFRSRPIRSNRATASVPCCLPRFLPAQFVEHQQQRPVGPARQRGGAASSTAFSSICAVSPAGCRATSAAPRRGAIWGDGPAPRLVRLGGLLRLGKVQRRPVTAVLLVQPVELGGHLPQLGLDALGDGRAVRRGGLGRLGQAPARRGQVGGPVGALPGDPLPLVVVLPLGLRQVGAHGAVQRRERLPLGHPHRTSPRRPAICRGISSSGVPRGKHRVSTRSSSPQHAAVPLRARPRWPVHRRARADAGCLGDGAAEGGHAGLQPDRGLAGRQGVPLGDVAVLQVLQPGGVGAETFGLLGAGLHGGEHAGVLLPRRPHGRLRARTARRPAR